jgi:murein DD-endopeptidase MepM/ murein hydrolase activator NlpD
MSLPDIIVQSPLPAPQVQPDLAAVAQGAKADPRTDPARVKALAAQFESMLLSQMMQQMRSSMFDDGDDKSNAPLADTLFSELSLAISRAGGLGLADSMLGPLQRATGFVPQAAELPAAKAADAIATATAQTPIMPSLAGRVSSAYGWRHDPIDDSVKFHKGVDIALPLGQEIPAPQAGKVVFAGEMSGYGQTVVLDHGNQVTTRYAHLSSIAVQVGDAVTAGQSIGQVGTTGRTTGPHLHFEVLEGGKSVNPSEKLTTYTTGRPQ